MKSMVDIGRKSESYDRENRFELSSYRVKSSSFVFKTVKLGENYRGPHLVGIANNTREGSSLELIRNYRRYRDGTNMHNRLAFPQSRD
jgi:hypothetical protein